MPRDIIIGRDEADKKKFGDKGLIYIGKSYVKMGRYTSLSNPVYMDIARSHVVLVSGKRGSGKCLHGDTLITLADGSKKPIKDLENDKEKVLSLNNHLKIKPAEKTEFFSRKVKKLLKIKLRSGKEIKITPEHPLFTIKGWKPAEKLNIGSRIATPRKTENFDRKNTNIDTIPKGLWETYKPKNLEKVEGNIGCETTKIAPSRQTLLQISKADQNKSLELLANSDIFWDKITSIEMLEGNFKVYDISVPNGHNFVANDIIVHNSYSLGAIAEELATLPKEEKGNVAGLIFDTMGIFWTMKYANEKETPLLQEWGLKPKQTPVRVFVPEGYYKEYYDRGLPIDKKFSIDPADLKAEDWVLTFNLDLTNPVAVLIERSVTDLKEGKKTFSIKEIIDKIDEDKTVKNETKNSATALFEAAQSWKIFSKGGTNIDELVKGGETSVLDLSMYGSVGAFNVRALVVATISRKLFDQRMMSRKSEEIQAVEKGIDYLSFETKREMPLVWLFVDECHEFIPDDKKTPATDDLIRLLREGRQPGISLIMATQQPGALARDVTTQSDIIISHRVTAKPDVDALNNIMQSYLLKGIKQYLDDLPRLKGSAIILDDNSERIYPMRMRPKFTWHGGEAPTAVKVKKRL